MHNIFCKDTSWLQVSGDGSHYFVVYTTPSTVFYGYKIFLPDSAQ